MNVQRGVWCAVLIVAASSVLLAKGVTTRIVVKGGQLIAPITITDPAVLERFNVWAGRGTYVNGVEGTEGFIVDWLTGPEARRPEGLPRYEVSFFVKFSNGPRASQGDELAYVVRYEWDRDRNVGYVYLPGPEDEFYGLNVRSIHRDGQNGHWFRSSRAWRDTIGPLLRNRDAVR